ncbi:copper amine oxidase N-terminal domain-containing protein [Paenibacillus endoradicis]|uniref:copper amine oxidase N-terminal domain-containing protein n=1 Tax=Paenibacillus endoradicis TaxID=2972487 RepID=UPI002158ED65|nr:copper amine oxidase N-terminal domain-containing protein [Paenibacillus endoradicis]MCR8660200.1 copper amine oxidase N-terminal domain-containing protein [Paenibacillus endoradicis]
MKVSRKILIFITVFSLLLSISSITYASGLLRKITAYQNLGIQIAVDNKTVSMKSDGVELYPITFEGRTYVPAKPLAEALGASVKWDGANNKVIVSSGKGTTSTGSTNSGSTSENNSSSNNSSSTTGTASTNKGTLSDPIKFGTAFTYNDTYNYKPGEYDNDSATYTLSITKAVPISSSEIEKLGFKPEPQEGISYMLVDVNLSVKNAKFTKGSSSDYDYNYLSSYVPNFTGVRTASNDSIIGVTDYGFDGSLSRNIDKVLPDFPKVGPKDSKSYSAAGSIIVPIFTNKENYLMVRRDDTNLEYDESYIYFKLKK